MPKQIVIIDLRGFVCADSTNFLAWAFLIAQITKLQFPQWIARHARAGVLCSYFYGIPLYTQRTIVKNLTKTMEIIIDFFFKWK